MKLYNYYASSASFRVRIALELKELAYEYVPVNLATGEHRSAEHMARSPDGMVPLLVTDEGFAINQSMAIIQYLDELYPVPPLLPEEAEGRGRARALAQTVACDVHPLNTPRVQAFLRERMGQDKAACQNWVQHWGRLGLESYERQLEAYPATRYSLGDQPTVADCCLVPQVVKALASNTPVDRAPRVMAIFEACMAHPAFQRARPEACPDFPG